MKLRKFKNIKILTDLAKTNYLMIRYNHIDMRSFEQIREDATNPIIANIPN